MKKTLLFPLIALCLCWAGYRVWDFFGKSRSTASSQTQPTGSQKSIGQVIDCALEKLVPGGMTRDKARATLDFLGEELAEGIDSYGMSSDVEKAHFLAQLMQESAYFTLTVEYAGGGTWRDEAVFDAGASAWKCGGYLNAVHSDKDFFDNRYDKSKDSYRAVFRGRGLIQLTFCYNYMRFFYHVMSKKQGYGGLQEDRFTYTHGGEIKRLRERFCKTEELESIAEGFARDGLPASVELTENFENTMDALSLPCPMTGVSFMQGPEFMVDSAFWFWGGCREEYPNAIDDPSAHAVGTLSGCVHGSERLYHRFDGRWCGGAEADEGRMEGFLGEVDAQKDKDDRRSVLTSYCRRLHNFNALMGCFDG